MDSQQIAVAPSLDEGITSRILSLLSDNVLVIIALVLIGMVVGIATVQFINKFRSDVDLLPPDLRRARDRQSQALGHLFGFVWTLGVVYSYLSGGFAAKAFMACGLAVIAGAGTPYMYDLIWWLREKAAPALGQWLLARLKSMFGPKAPPP